MHRLFGKIKKIGRVSGKPFINLGSRKRQWHPFPLYIEPGPGSSTQGRDRRACFYFQITHFGYHLILRLFFQVLEGINQSIQFLGLCINIGGDPYPFYPRAINGYRPDAIFIQ